MAEKLLTGTLNHKQGTELYIVLFQGVNIISVYSKSAGGGTVAKLMAPTNPASDPSVKVEPIQQVPSLQNSVSLTAPTNGMVPSPVTNTVISIPNVVKPEMEKQQEGKELYV